MYGPSKTAAYAIQAMVCLARHPDGVRGVEQVGGCSETPRSYLVKVLNILAHHGLVATKRGYRGGYRLGKKASEISLFDIVTAIDGEDAFDRCLLGLGRCTEHRECPMHPIWSGPRAALERRFQELTLDGLKDFERWKVERDYRFGSHVETAHGDR